MDHNSSVCTNFSQKLYIKSYEGTYYNTYNSFIFSQTLYKGMNEGTIDPKRMRKVLNYIDRKRNKISQESH